MTGTGSIGPRLDQALLSRSSGRFLARRSLFSGAGKSVLVTEVFLPGLPPPPAG